MRVDLVVSAVLLLVSQVEVWRFGVAGGRLPGAVCLAAIAIVSAWRTRFPLASAAGVIALAFVCAAWAGLPGSVTFASATILAFYRIGTLPDRRRAYAALAGGMVIAVGMFDNFTLNGYLGVALASFAVPWLLGTLWLREQRTRALEREREQVAERERERLARELHDLVSHNVGMILVQAGAGDVLLDREPERTREALHAIEAGARDALLELRRLLGLLRGHGEAELAPQPGLSRLNELVERVRNTGLEVSLVVEGEAGGVDPAVDLSAYRIIQEGLTNVLKHASATRADVFVRRCHGTIEIEIDDDGEGAGRGGGGGHGLVGIGERVSLLGGKLEAGSRPGGGFQLRAWLPETSRTVTP